MYAASELARRRDASVSGMHRGERWLGFPFMMVIALGRNARYSARAAGGSYRSRASRWQQFWHITLPMLKPVCYRR